MHNIEEEINELFSSGNATMEGIKTILSKAKDKGLDDVKVKTNMMWCYCLYYKKGQYDYKIISTTSEDKCDLKFHYSNEIFVL